MCCRRAFDRDLLDALPKLRRISRAITKDATAAEDLLQTALMKAISYHESYQSGSNMAAWVGQIMRNQFYTERRRAWRTVEMAEGQAERIPLPASAHHAVELKDALKALTYLNPEQLEAFVAIVLEDESYEDAAIRLGCEIGSIKSRVSRARDAIGIYFGGV